MCDLQLRRGEYEEALALGEQSFAVQQVSGDLPAPGPLLVHEFMARPAQAVRDFPKAVAHFRDAVALSQGDPGSTADRRLGLREALGRNLHKAGAYDEARAVNLAALGDAEELHGVSDPRLRSVLNNLAQHEHELHNPTAAKAYLERRLQIARDTHQLDIELDTLFQLGVLAFESGRETEARRLMTERPSLARAREAPMTSPQRKKPWPSGTAGRPAARRNDLTTNGPRHGRRVRSRPCCRRSAPFARWPCLVAGP
jgi:tetratricopeptide (TPR) repeat protein